MSRSNDLMELPEFSSFYMEPSKSSDTSDYKREKHRLTWRFSSSEVLVGTSSEVGTFCQHTRHIAQKAHILPSPSLGQTVL